MMNETNKKKKSYKCVENNMFDETGTGSICEVLKKEVKF